MTESQDAPSKPRYYIPYTVLTTYTRRMRQAIASRWSYTCYGKEAATNLQERCARVVEEAIELAQAGGLTQEFVQTVLERVYKKAPGELLQEMGGVEVTMMILAESIGRDADSLGTTELHRILSKPPEHFTKRHAAKIAEGICVIPPNPVRQE